MATTEAVDSRRKRKGSQKFVLFTPSLIGVSPDGSHLYRVGVGDDAFNPIGYIAADDTIAESTLHMQPAIVAQPPANQSFYFVWEKDDPPGQGWFRIYLQAPDQTKLYLAQVDTSERVVILPFDGSADGEPKQLWRQDH
ncbi:hypothetical protein [Streptomyces collinus]|uniref:hypothetical protein n=1 Tax=Streptomyces collinus TaxID=42684 RepID=UPI00332D7990